MPDLNTTRLLDASANRAAEGLRVVEDYVRFVLGDGHLTRLLKQLRHDLAATCAGVLGEGRYAARDTPGDVGTTINTEAEGRRLDGWAVCIASIERTKQSLRSLEEFSKISTPELSKQFEALRYRLYTLEKAICITDSSCKRLADANLCVLVDGKNSVAQFSAILEQLCEAGVGMIQLRDKRLASRELLKRAKTLVSICQQSSGHTSPITIINDHADIAAVVNAEGVHLGQDDLGVKEARTLLGPRKLIGISTHSIEQAQTAVLDGANYLGAGPTFPSTTKSFDRFPGLEYLQQVATEISLPVFAIGGIDAGNLGQVLGTGIVRVAVSGVVSSASNPCETVSGLLGMLDRTAIRSNETP